MAESNNDYKSGLEALLGGSTPPSQLTRPQTPEKDMQDIYEETMDTKPSGLQQLVESQSTPPNMGAYDEYMTGLAAQEREAEKFSTLDERRLGPAPDQQIIDPAMMVGTAGQKIQRGLKAGWGDLVAGTGDAIDFVGASIMPGQQADLTTPVGEYLKKIGTEYQNENLLILSEDLQDFHWDDLFTQEFWTSKFSRMLPYTLSFALPYAGGSWLGTSLLGRFGPSILKAAGKSGKFGRMGKGTKLKDMGFFGKTGGQAGTGVLGKLGVDLGKRGVKPTQFLRNTTGYIGGGGLANMMEGAYLSGEAYQEMVNETDENGEPLFTPDEAAAHAAGVMRDNAKWMGIDMLQYGILFGGMGRGMIGKLVRNPVKPEPFAFNAKALIGMLTKRVLPHLPPIAAYASIESITEGFQEVYQEWAKYKNIQEAKGLDYEPMTTWLKEAPFGEDRPELRDIFWSAVGMGGAMGGARGYFDSMAERKSLLDGKADAYNNVLKIMSNSENLSPEEYTKAFDQSIANLMASNVWDYSGDGSVAMSIIDNMVKDKKLTEDAANEYKTAIEESEKNYEKHSVNTGLTEAGAKQAFFNETVLSVLEKQKEDQISSYNEFKEKQKKAIGDGDQLNNMLEQAEIEHLGIIETIEKEQETIRQRIEDIYTRKLDTAPIAESTGQRDKRYKEKGLKEEEFEAYTQEGEKQKAEREKKEAEAKAEEKTTVIDKVKDVGSKVVKGVKDVVGAVVKGVQPKEKRAQETINNYTDKEITSTAKTKLNEAIEKGEITAVEALEIKPTGRGNTINNRDVDLGIKRIKRQAEKKTKETDKSETEDLKKKEITEVSEEIYNEFVDKGTVPQGVVNLIADKVKKNQKLTPQEESIRQAKSEEIETLLREDTIIPKSKEYESVEKSIQEKGKPLSFKEATISKVVDKEGKASPRSYILKTTKGKTRKFFTYESLGAEEYTRTPQDIELRLVTPVKGGKDVVEVNGKTYFQFKKGAPLYESKIEVVVEGKAIGELSQAPAEFYKSKGPTKKAKKKDKRTIDKIVSGIKIAKERFSKILKNNNKDIPQYKTNGVESHPLYRRSGGVGAAQLVREIVNKKFPGARGYVAFTNLMTDFGEEASSLAIGSVVFINENSVRQSDIIHETGHIYYNIMSDTPLMERIKKLLPKSELFERTKQDYPELILMKYKGDTATLGEWYTIIHDNTNNKRYSSLLGDLVKNIKTAEMAGDSARINDLFKELRIQLKLKGAKDLKVSEQRHLLEETFARTLENYSYGTVDAVIKDTAAQKQLEKDLIKFYKETKKLATDAEAKRLLDLSVDNIQSLDLEAAIKHILLDYNSGDRTVPFVLNSGYGPTRKAIKKSIRKGSTYSAIASSIGDYVDRDRGLTDLQITNRVLKDLAKNAEVPLKEVSFLRDSVKAIITQLTRPSSLKQADEKLEEIISKIGIRGEAKDDITGEPESNLSETNQYNEGERAIALPTTTSNFIKKIVEVHNYENPNNIIEKKQLLYELYTAAKKTMYDPYDFINAVRKKGTPEVNAMLKILDRVYGKDKVLTNAKLMEIKGPIEGINIEVLTQQALEIGIDGARKWRTYKTTNATLEKSVIDSIKNQLYKNDEIGKKIADVYNNLFDKKDYKAKDETATYNAAKRILNIILDENPKGKLINKDALLDNLITFNGKRQYLKNILFDHTRFKSGRPNLDNQSLIGIDKDGNFAMKVGRYKAQGLIHGKQGELKQILTEGLIASRAINYLSIVDNVEGDGVSVFNKENGLHNRGKNVAKLINEGIEIDTKDIIHWNNNIYSAILLRRKELGQLADESTGEVAYNPFNLTIHSGMMRSLLSTADPISYQDRAAKLTNVNPNELIAGDFFKFLSAYNEGIKKGEDAIFYDQPIAVFSDKSRRPYIESIAAHDARTRKLLLSKIERNPGYEGTYQDYEKELKKLKEKIKKQNINEQAADKLKKDLFEKHRIFPYDIENGKIKQMPKLLKKWTKWRRDNKGLFEDVEDYYYIDKETKERKKYSDKYINNAMEAFLTSYIANKFMAQQMFIHDHRQSKNQVDYIKRAAGAIASHIVFDRNTMVEPIIIKDYYTDREGNMYTEEKDGTAIENDAMGYILPKQAEFIRAKYGEAQKVGNVFKFVYHNTELEGKLKGKTTYLKFAVHVLTDKLQSTSPYLKNIGTLLKKRQEQVDELSGNPGNLIIAASESAAKLFKDGIRSDEHIYDITSSEDIDGIMAKQDEIYSDEKGYRALSGEGLGIQLELDKESDERFFPSQLFYNLVSNMRTDEDKQLVKDMLALRKKVMEANNVERNINAGLIMNDTATEDTVKEEKKGFESSMSADIYGVLLDSVYDNLDPRYPFMNATYNSIATGRITHNGTKMYTKGSIAYQSSSLGMGLKSYQAGLFKDNPSIIASEAIIPGYMKNKGVKIGDLFIGTRVPAHGKVSSSIFVVKDFHDQIGNSPTSNITIPAHVSKNWGADLDGDSIHMNFKWTDAEVRKKEWMGWSNEFFDKYVQLISREDKQAEITADIGFEKPVANALDGVYKAYGKPKEDRAPQLEPWGDAEMFNDNIPAKALVGIVAALQRSFNVFSNNNEPLPFDITLKGEGKSVTRKNFFDDPSLDNGAGNWFGVAQLLNIVLDNAKHQFASKLGLDKQSVFPYIMLRRLGYSLNDLAVLFNSPIVKEYMQFKRERSKDYISKHSDIKKMFNEDQSINFNELVEFFKESKFDGYKKLISKKGGYNMETWDKLVDRIKSGIDLDINKLAKRDKASEIDAILMLYALSKFNKDVVKPFGKAFTVHQSIEKNPLELREIKENIEKIRAGTIVINSKERGGLNLPYTMMDSKSSEIVTHALDLFDKSLQRASRTDIRYTPYMKKIFTEDFYSKLKEGYFGESLKDKTSEVVNRVIINNLKNEIPFLKNTTFDRKKLVEKFKELQNKSDNNFIKNALSVGRKKGGEEIVTINRAEITDMISYKAIEQYKNLFGKLTKDEKDFIFELEAEFNGFGIQGGAGSAGSFIPFFDNKYVQDINDEISRIIEDNQTREPGLSKTIIGESKELNDAISDIKDPYKNFTNKEKRKEGASQNNTFSGPIKKPKKIITPNTSYNTDYLRQGVEELSFPKWAADKGIDINKVEKKSKIYKDLINRYNRYKEHLKIVKEFEQDLKKKPLSKYTSIESLLDIAQDFRKMDNSATKGIAHAIEKEIGQRAFREQAEFLRSKGKEQDYEYNVPGEDGVPQEDLTNFRTWLGSNNMTSKRPEIQYLINEAQKEYRKYLRSFTIHKNLIYSADEALKRSKLKGLSVLERMKKGFDTDARYKYIYGNIATVENGNVRLYTPEEIEGNWNNLSKEERRYYTEYKALAERMIGNLDANNIIVPGSQMGTLESMSRSGLFGLYSSIIDSSDYDRVKVKGIDKDGNKVLKTFYEWKYDVYKGRTGKIKLASGREIFELDKLRRKAKEYKQKGIHEDRTKIMLTDAEYDALIDNGSMMKRMVGHGITDIDAELMAEYERRQGVKAKEITYDIHSTLVEFIRGSLFMHGENLEYAKKENREGFTGMGRLAILTDSIIGFNKNLDNDNAVKYLTTWWKEGFIEKKRQVGPLGKTGDKVIDGFVQLTSLRLLGFNLGVGFGNLLAGKYQELRKRGGKQFIKGEARFWKDFSKSQDILKKYRIVEYSFDEFIHLSEKKGPWGVLERWGYKFMDASESYIQGAAFLGELTNEEFKTGEIDEMKVMDINNKISTLHGEGYTALDANMLAMYSYGRALLQFKKWFVTLVQDRIKPEDIDRFGRVTIGSYRAAGSFVNSLFKKFWTGELTAQDVIKTYNDSSENRKKEIKAYINGIGIGVVVLSLISILEDEDEPDMNMIRSLKKLSHDIFVTTDMNRFVNYTIIPASFGTLKNANQMIGEAVSGEKIKRTGPYGEKGESQAFKTLTTKLMPYSELRKDWANLQYEGPKEKKETSSLIR